MAKPASIVLQTGLAVCLASSLCAQSQEDIWARQSNSLILLGGGHALVSDSARKQVMLLGGSAVETAIWDGASWTNLLQDPRPPRRQEHAMAFDPSRQRVVLFGGRETGGSLGLMNDTWEWDGKQWTELPAAMPPTAREGHALAYDSINQRILLFGGLGGSGALADTWAWDGQTWSLISPQTSPPPTHGHSMALEEQRGRVLLCSGQALGPGSASVPADTWAWDGVTWLNLGWAPEVREQAMTYDPVLDRCVLFGGLSIPTNGGTPSPQSETWVWSGGSWSLASPNESPRPMSGHAMAFDHANNRIMSVNENFFADPGPMADMWNYFVPQLMPELNSFGSGCGSSAGVPELYPWHAYWLWVGESCYLYLQPQPEPGSNHSFGIIGVSDSFDANLGLSLPYDLQVIGMNGCPLLVSTEKIVPINSGGTPRFWGLVVPEEMTLLGMRIFLQGYTLDSAANPTGVAVSNGLEAVIGLR